jgi:hypothetical protein
MGDTQQILRSVNNMYLLYICYIRMIPLPESQNDRKAGTTGPVIIEKSEVPEKQVRLDDPRANIY